MMKIIIRLISTACIPVILIACGEKSGGSDNTSSPVQTEATSSNSNNSDYTPPIDNPENDATPSDNQQLPAEIHKSLTLSWTPPTAREDASPLLANDIQGYEVYYVLYGSSDEHTTPINDPAATNYTTPPLSPGTYYFAISAIDTQGAYSDISKPLEVSRM